MREVIPMSFAVMDPHLPDIFSLSSLSSQENFDTRDERTVREAHLLASEQKRLDTIEALLTLPTLYRQDNWNGEGARAIPDTAIEEARLFLERLPETIPLPEIIFEPDGYLGLEWYANQWKLYVVSFNGTGTVSCSGLNGAERIYGTRYLDEGIPAEILRNIAKVLR
jgi:hypothetical protein